MSKVRNFAELAPNIGFSEFDSYDLYRSTFEKSELGKILKEIRKTECAYENAQSLLTSSEKDDLEIITRMCYCKENGIQTSFVKRGE